MFRKSLGLVLAILLNVTNIADANILKDRIYVYRDAGVSEESYKHTVASLSKHFPRCKTLPITANAVKKGEWRKNALLFVMPGGADLPYVEKLAGRGNQMIKQYVREGGSYLGLCAGGYYGASYVEFDKGGSLEVLGDRELKFFEGKAVGPILAPYDYKTNSGSRAAKLVVWGESMPNTKVYYNGGAYFHHAERYQNTEIVAWYESHKAAIIKIRYGKGNVILSGVHFEYDPALLDNKDPYLKKIIPALQKEAASREVLVSRVYQLLRVSAPV